MSLNDLIAKHHHELRQREGIFAPALLHALAEVESAHGLRETAAKHEQRYCYGGFYYKSPNGEDLRNLTHIHGCLAHCSFSSWQILFIAAYEEGFRGDPCELRNDSVAMPFLLRYINRRILDRYPRILPAGVADAWNSGNPRDATIPQQYIAEFMEAYEKWEKELRAREH